MSDGIKVASIEEAGDLSEIVGVYTYDGDDVDIDVPVGGLDPLSPWKAPAVAATIANITIATALNDADTLDGVTLATGDRVLVKDQTAAAENGIYIVGTTPERAPDMDDDDEVVGAVVTVTGGTVNAGRVYRTTNATDPVIDTDAIVWVTASEPTADAHIADTSDAHDASAISFDPTGLSTVTGTDVQTAIEELDAASHAAGVLHNFAATTDPTTGDDSGDGYAVGSRWVNTTSDEEFVCLDASVGAAVWASTTATGSGSGDASGQLAGGFDGGGSAITAGSIYYGVVPFDGTITDWIIQASGSSNAEFDVALAAAGTRPTFPTDSIVASAPPAMTGDDDAASSTLTGWTTALTAGQRFAIKFVSGTATWAQLVINYSRP